MIGITMSGTRARSERRTIYFKILSGAKKIPDKQTREDMVNRLEEAVKERKSEIENKYAEKFEQLNKEKEALKKAIDDTQGMNMQERNQEIQKQREEFERQRELERQKQLEEQNRRR